MLDEFGRHDVALVSVSQEIDTTGYFGKLTSNILMSFAEFERELIGQRVKEKREQTLRAGFWQGASCPLGYVVNNRRLVIDQQEAETVKEIFERYARGESVTSLIKDLNSRGLRTKRWLTVHGRPRGERPYDLNAIYVILKNRVYLAEAFFNERWQPVDHDPIITQELWALVEANLANHTRRGTKKKTVKTGTSFLLKGILFGSDGRAMSPWQSSPYKNRVYTYYIPQREIAEGAGA